MRKTGNTVMQTTKGTGADGREAVRMYPSNSLREPVRDRENFVFELVKTSFDK